MKSINLTLNGIILANRVVEDQNVDSTVSTLRTINPDAVINVSDSLTPSEQTYVDSLNIKKAIKEGFQDVMTQLNAIDSATISDANTKKLYKATKDLARFVKDMGILLVNV